MSPAREHGFVYYDLADVSAKRPKDTARLRADYLLGRCSDYMQRNGAQHLTILLSPRLGDVAEVLKAMTQLANITVEIEPMFREMKAGVQGSV